MAQNDAGRLPEVKALLERYSFYDQALRMWPTRRNGSREHPRFFGEAVATARSAAGGKNLEILGADVAGQCLRRGLVDEILVYVLPVLLGDGIRFSSPGLARIDLEPVSSTRSGAVTILRFRVRK
jgi:dihydrofolate reductase